MGGKGKRHKKKQAPRSAESRKNARSSIRSHSTGSGWQDDFPIMQSRLRLLGLEVKAVLKDGNCLFRSLADQLFGQVRTYRTVCEDKHVEIRKDIVGYLRQHEEDYAAFVEDNVPFAEYCNQLESCGAWGGQLELQAASLFYKVNIIVYQGHDMTFSLNNFSDEVLCLQLAYHNGDHYNSVRFADDMENTGPARKADLRTLRSLHELNAGLPSNTATDQSTPSHAEACESQVPSSQTSGSCEKATFETEATGDGLCSRTESCPPSTVANASLVSVDAVDKEFASTGDEDPTSAGEAETPLDNDTRESPRNESETAVRSDCEADAAAQVSGCVAPPVPSDNVDSEAAEDLLVSATPIPAMPIPATPIPATPIPATPIPAMPISPIGGKRGSEMVRLHAADGPALVDVKEDTCIAEDLGYAASESGGSPSLLPAAELASTKPKQAEGSSRAERKARQRQKRLERERKKINIKRIPPPNSPTKFADNNTAQPQTSI